MVNDATVESDLTRRAVVSARVVMATLTTAWKLTTDRSEIGLMK